MIIDTHVHWKMDPFAPAADLLKVMDQHGLDISVVSGWEVLFKIPTMQRWNTALGRFCQQGGRRVIGLGTVHLAEADAAVTEAVRCLDQLNLAGFKVHSWLQGETMFCPAMYEICQLCARHEAVLMFHDGTPDYAMSSQVGILARMFPRTRFLLGHSGIQHYWREAIQVARQNQNVYLTLCGGHAWALRTICAETDPDRIVFGTDFIGPGPDHALTYRKSLVQRLPITDQLREKVFRSNALRLFNLEGEPEN